MLDRRSDIRRTRVGRSVMKRVALISLIAVLALFQQSWGYQSLPQAQNSSGGLCDVVFEIVTAPCSLLEACLGLDTRPGRCPQGQQLKCVPATSPCKPPRYCPRGTKTTGAAPPHRRSMTPSTAIHRSLPQSVETPVTFPTVEKQKSRSPHRNIVRGAGPPIAEVPRPPLPETKPAPATEIRLPCMPVRIQRPHPSIKEEIPAPSEGRPKFPDILPGASEDSVPVPANPGQPPPTLDKDKPTSGPSKEYAPERPSSTVTPATSKMETTAPPPQKRKSRETAPCMPTYPPACGPSFFYR